MSLQITTGPGALVSLGVAVSDVATLISLSTRVGSWLTASTGDSQLLEILKLDEFDIIQRRGVIDKVLFNKQWRTYMAFLTNNECKIVKGKSAEDRLEELSRFTAIMTCIVAALDAFSTPDLVQTIVRKLLLELLRTTEQGEAVVKAQLQHRLKSWRSCSIIRGISAEARKIRRKLIQRKNIVLDGLIPTGEVPYVVDFLAWLLTRSSDRYLTASSDVTGIAFCLSKLGIHSLGVSQLGEESTTARCWLEFDPNVANMLPGHSGLPTNEYWTRTPCTTVNLQCPEESLSKFPVDAETAERCRIAWKEGQSAAKAIRLSVNASKGFLTGYTIECDSEPVDKRTRHRSEVSAIASALTFADDRKVTLALERIFQTEPNSALVWLRNQFADFRFSEDNTKIGIIPADIERLEGATRAQISAFTVLQAFFMGYYYGVVLSMVDIDLLLQPVVEGAWGFRSARFLNIMSAVLVEAIPIRPPRPPPPPKSFDGITSSEGEDEPDDEDEPEEGKPKRILQKDVFFSIVSTLLLGVEIDIPFAKSTNAQQPLLGAVKTRALLMRSLILPCVHETDVGRYIILDVDVSGIPTDRHGLVRAGVADLPSHAISGEEFLVQNLFSSALKVQDGSFHIEADWDGDPETVIVCVRYMGRRVRAINPNEADVNFLKSYCRPKDHQAQLNLAQGEPCPWSIFNFLTQDPTPQKSGGKLQLRMELQEYPRLRYFVSHLYRMYGIRVYIVGAERVDIVVK